MAAGRVGASLVIAGGLLLAISIVLLALYGGIGTGTIPGLLLAASLALIGAGTAILCLAGLRPVASRIGLAFLSIGLLCISAFSFVISLTQADPMRGTPLILLGVIGYLSIPAGVLLTASSLAWQRLRHRSERGPR